MHVSTTTTRLRELRKKHGLTLKDLAGKLRTTPQTIQRLETGAMTVSVLWLSKFAEVFDVPLAALLDERMTATAENALLEVVRGELTRTRRTVPSPLDAPLALMHASGMLGETLLEWKAGLTPWEKVTIAAAATAAAAIRLALDGERTVEPSAASRFVVNRS
jgi:transcriptional regulator with XRE-family HTH domain